MIIKHFYILILIPILGITQKNMYLGGEIEGGLLTSKYESLTPKLNQSIVNSESDNYSFKIAASFLLEWERNIFTEIGISQSMRLWNIEGKKNNNVLKVKHKQLFPSAFIGAHYQIPLVSKRVNLQLYIGSRFSVDFINYNSLNDQDGTTEDYVISTTDESSKIGLNIIPEIGLKGIFSNDNTWQLGVRYYQPLNGNIINGEIKQFQNNTLIEKVSYNASGQVLALSFKYNYKLKK